jgi:hypothetical protein
VKYWQLLAILATLSASIALADDFKTINGKEYKNVAVSRVEPDGIVIKSKSGISKVYFTELPKAVQERFHYDTEKSATYSSEQNAALEQRRNEQETPLVTPAVISSATPVSPMVGTACLRKSLAAAKQERISERT